MANLWREFQSLLPKTRTVVAEVVGDNGDGTSTVETPSGARFVVQGDSVPVGSNAFIRNGWIEGDAPTLPFHSYTV